MRFPQMAAWGIRQTSSGQRSHCCMSLITDCCCENVETTRWKRYTPALTVEASRRKLSAKF
jgi:hypothetical protein